MSKVSISQVFDVSSDQLWAIVGDPAGISAWHPAIADSPTSGGGKQRRCTLADGATIVEEITGHDAASRAYSYRIVESPLPVKDYASTLRVRDSGAGAELVWESTFEAAGAPSAEVEALIRQFYEAGFAALGQRFAGA